MREYLDQMADKDHFSEFDPEPQAIHQMGPEGIPYLRRALRSEDSIREKGLALIQKWLPKRLGKHFPLPVPATHLKLVVLAATRCLVALGPIARPAVPDLFHCAKKGGALAAETLGEMGPKAGSAVPALSIALRDGVESVRVAATNALKRIDPVAAARLGVK